MSKGDSTTLRVKLGLRDSELLNAVSSLGSEGLINFENVDIGNSETAFLESSRDSESGTNSHNLGWDTSGSEANNAANNFAAVTVGDISTSQHDA